MRICARLAVSLLLISTPAAASSQLSGTFHFAKDRHLLGEPLYLMFEVANNGTKPVRIREANPLTCGGYLFNISGEKRADGTCDGLHGYSCMVWSVLLAPGQKTTQKILLNYFYEFPHPGIYRIQAQRALSWWPAALGAYGQAGEQEKFDVELEIDITPPSPAELRAAFRPYVRALRSENRLEKTQAAEAIAYTAPPFLEDTMLKRLGTDDDQSVLLFLRNVNNSKARLILSDLVRFNANEPPPRAELKVEDKSWKGDFAIEYLGEMGDQSYLPLLLKTTQEAPLESQTRIFGTSAVARLGREQAIPFLTSEIQASTIGQRIQGALALSLTASRVAVPLLIDLLQSPQLDVRQVAENSLEMLTHRAALLEGNVSGLQPEPLHNEWRDWWVVNGDSARIYGPDECGEKVLID